MIFKASIYKHYKKIVPFCKEIIDFLTGFLVYYRILFSSNCRTSVPMFNMLFHLWTDGPVINMLFQLWTNALVINKFFRYERMFL